MALLLALSLILANLASPLVSAAPSITSISVNSGPTAGGEEVILHGSGFLEDEKIVQAVSAPSYSHIVALTDTERVFMLASTWDLNTGQKVIAPSNLSSYFENDPIKQLVSGSSRDFYALTASGKVFNWGDDSNGNLSDPTDITNSVFSGITVTQILPTASGSEPIFLSSTRQVYSINWDGTPDLIGEIPNNETVKSSAGFFVLTESGDVILLNPGTTARLSDFIAGEEFNNLFTGNCNNFYATTTSGKIYAWGDNSNGFYSAYQLGNGGGASVPFSAPVDLSNAFNNENVIALTGHYCQQAALTDSGKIFTWGGSSAVSTPSNTRFGLSGLAFQSLAPNTYWSSDVPFFAKTTDGRIFAWGQNTSGQFGMGEGNAMTDATDVTNYFPDGTNLESTFYVGAYFGANWLISIFGLTTDGKLLAWGNNTDGFLDSTNPNSIIPPFDYSETLGLQTFPSVTSILFDDTEVDDFEVLDANTIRLRVPAHSAGNVLVSLTTRSGETVTLQSGYTYLDGSTDPQTLPSNPNTADRAPLLILFTALTLGVAIPSSRRISKRR